MQKKNRSKEPSEAVKLATEGRLNAESAEPLWRKACAGLPRGERPPFRQVTFTLHDSQWAILDRALKRAIAGGAKSRVNANRNGNAIAVVCRQWLASQKSPARPHRRNRGQCRR